MTISNNSSARKAGFRATNAGIEAAAAITMTKIGTRTLKMAFNPTDFTLSGASVAASADGIFSVVLFPNANTGTMIITSRLAAEWKSGTDLIASVYWKSSGISGNMKLSIQLGAKADAESTASSNTQTVTTAAATTANKLVKSQVTFSNSLLAAGDWLGLSISRDPTDAADTLASDIYIACVVMEFTGRG